MGHEKNRADAIEDHNRIAEEVLVRANVAARCREHEHILVKTWTTEVAAAYALGTNMTTTGKVACSRDELMAAIQRVYDVLPERCQECARKRGRLERE